MTRHAFALAVLVSTGCTYVTIVEPGADAGEPVDASHAPDAHDAGSIDADASTPVVDAGTDAGAIVVDAGSDAGLMLDDAGSDAGETDSGPACGLTCRELGCGAGYLCVGLPCPICRPVCTLDGGTACPEGTSCVPQTYSEPGEGICT
jgi:hypothetical protein